MLKKMGFKIIMVLISLLMSSFVFAEKLVIVAEGWAPYEYFENGVAKGTDSDFVTEVLKKMGHTVEIKEMPWERCLKMIEDGKANAVISLYKNKEREMIMYFPNEPINRDENVLLVAKGKKVKYDGTIASLEKSKIAFMTGNFFGEEFDKALKNKLFEVTPFNKKEEMLMAVAKNRLEYGVENRLVALDVANKAGIMDKLDILEPPISSGDLYIGFSKKITGSDKIAEQFSIEAVKFKKSPEYKKIVEKYKLNK